jgi:hypothetical protein
LDRRLGAPRASLDIASWQREKSALLGIERSTQIVEEKLKELSGTEEDIVSVLVDS